MVSFRGRSYRDTSNQPRRIIVTTNLYTSGSKLFYDNVGNFRKGIRRWLNRGANSRIRCENWKLIETIAVKIETMLSFSSSSSPRVVSFNSPPPSAFFPAFHRLFPCFSMSEHDTPDWFNSIRMIGYSIPVSRTNKWKVENDKMWRERGVYDIMTRG